MPAYHNSVALTLRVSEVCRRNLFVQACLLTRSVRSTLQTMSHTRTGRRMAIKVDNRRVPCFRGPFRGSLPILQLKGRESMPQQPQQAAVASTRILCQRIGGVAGAESSKPRLVRRLTQPLPSRCKITPPRSTGSGRSEFLPSDHPALDHFQSSGPLTRPQRTGWAWRYSIIARITFGSVALRS